MSLSDAAIRRVKPSDRPKKMADGFGLYLLVNPNGSRWWRFKYRYLGKEKLLSLGVYPEISLATARERRDAARGLLKTGADPSQVRQAAKQIDAPEDPASGTFDAVARQWMERQTISHTTARKNQWLLDSFLLPRLGSLFLRDISSRLLLQVLREIEATGKHETAKRAKIKAGQIFRFAIMEGLCENDPTASLQRSLKPVQTKHHAAVTDPARIGALLRAIDNYDGRPITTYALKLAPLLFVRPGELRRAVWSEFDLNEGLWRIPGERMKMKVPHVVPLATQTIALLNELHQLSGDGIYLFPSRQLSRRHLGENTLNRALRRLGYDKSEMTAHGFRSMAATRLNELGWNNDAIERQLAHTEPNKVRAAYTHAAQYLEERRRMMQAWANYLDALRRQRRTPAHETKHGRPLNKPRRNNAATSQPTRAPATQARTLPLRESSAEPFDPVSSERFKAFIERAIKDACEQT